MFTSYEQFIMEVLDCGISDISMLFEVYSKLADEVIDTRSIIKDLVKNDMLDMNSLLYETYYQVADEIITTAQDLLRENEELQENLGEELTKKVLAYIEEMQNEPYCNYQDTHFNNDIDLTIDWENNVGCNANDLISYVAQEISKE